MSLVPERRSGGGERSLPALCWEPAGKGKAMTVARRMVNRGTHTLSRWTPRCSASDGAERTSVSFVNGPRTSSARAQEGEARKLVQLKNATFLQRRQREEALAVYTSWPPALFLGPPSLPCCRPQGLTLLFYPLSSLELSLSALSLGFCPQKLRVH